MAAERRLNETAPAPAGTDAVALGRRQIITSTGAGWLALLGAGAAGTLALQRFLFPNVADNDDGEQAVGDLARFAEMPIGGVDERYMKQGFWVVRLGDRLVALSTECTHLGCALAWQADQRRFRCPCHGSGFTPEGVNLDGPAPRAMDRLRVTIRDGVVFVDGRRRFQYERGGWSHPESFIPL